MRITKVLVLVLIFVLGCETWSGFRAEEVAVTVRVVQRIVELIEDPVFDPEACPSDVVLLNELAKYIADRIDGGDASQSGEWALATMLSEAISDLGCDFDPEDWGG